MEAAVESRRLLQHFLGALAYRTQKALREAPPGFADFRAAPTARTPYELLWHMTGLIGYADDVPRWNLPAAAARDSRC